MVDRQTLSVHTIYTKWVGETEKLWGSRWVAFIGLQVRWGGQESGMGKKKGGRVGVEIIAYLAKASRDVVHFHRYDRCVYNNKTCTCVVYCLEGRLGVCKWWIHRSCKVVLWGGRLAKLSSSKIINSSSSSCHSDENFITWNWNAKSAIIIGAWVITGSRRCIYCRRKWILFFYLMYLITNPLFRMAESYSREIIVF